MASEKPSLDMRVAFRGLQEEMRAALASTRASVTHTTSVGDVSETHWVDLFEKYLPGRYCVERAAVVDHEGNASQQIDVVIFDRHFSPFLLNRKGALHVPAESVYAVIEVKQTLDKATLVYSAEKAASVRALKRTSQVITHAGGIINKPKQPFAIPAGIVALDSGWSPALGDTMIEVLRGLPEEQRIEFGCVLDAGGFEVDYAAATPTVTASERDDALIFTFLRLLSRLQKLGSVPAIDLDAYSKVFATRVVK